MCVALLTYADLSARLNVSREAARSLGATTPAAALAFG
ncbi:hypothetical protein ABH977_001701 [Bradyrhizobium ottawaense]